MDSNMTRRVALYELLAKPDPPELHRGHVPLSEGKPDRHAWVPVLAEAFVRTKLIEIRERHNAAAGSTT